jgi:hypothetical protein
MSTEVVHIGNDRLPVTKTDLNALQEKRDVLKEFVKSQLKEGIDNDFAVIPGTNKKSLLKPGAEKLMQLFGLGSRLTMTMKEIDHNGNFALVAYKCEIFHLRSGMNICECEGVANSREKKYASRTVWTKQDGRSIKSQEETPIYDILNTLIKMAQKRAIVGAVIQATAASDFFTQDLDDETEQVQAGVRAEVRSAPSNDSSKTEKITITGNTITHKDTIKEHGGKWDLNAKAWVISSPSKETVELMNSLEGLEIK